MRQNKKHKQGIEDNSTSKTSANCLHFSEMHQKSSKNRSTNSYISLKNIRICSSLNEIVPITIIFVKNNFFKTQKNSTDSYEKCRK